jgi:hypothetical protein
VSARSANRCLRASAPWQKAADALRETLDVEAKAVGAAVRYITPGGLRDCV